MPGKGVDHKNLMKPMGSYNHSSILRGHGWLGFAGNNIKRKYYINSLHHCSFFTERKLQMKMIKHILWTAIQRQD